MAWPKNVEIMSGSGVIKVPVDSWAELKEAMAEFGSLIIGISPENTLSRDTAEQNGSD